MRGYSRSTELGRTTIDVIPQSGVLQLCCVTSPLQASYPADAEITAAHPNSQNRPSIRITYNSMTREVDTMHNKLKLGLATLLVIALITASVVSTSFNSTATADNLNPSPNVTFTGDTATVSWEAQPAAASYRIGWTTMPEVRTAIAAEIPWTERFAYTDVRASITSHSISPMAPAIQHAFVVGTKGSNGAYIWSEWNILSTPTNNCDCSNYGNRPLVPPPPPPTAAPEQEPTVTPSPTVRPNTPTRGEGGRSITVSPENITSTSTITISGSSFTANGSIEIVHIANTATPSDLDDSWNSSTSALYEYLRSFGNVIHTVTGDSNGDFSTSFSVNNDEFAAGANYIAAKQAGLNGLSSATFRLTYSP